MNNNKEYHTKDLPMIAMLVLMGHSSTGMYWQGKEAYFVFNGLEYCSKVAENYYSGKLRIDPHIFFEKVKAIRNSIKDYKNIENGENANGKEKSKT